MIYKKLQNIDTEVSALALGSTFYNGENLDEKQAASQMEFFMDNGGNLIDTAHVYGFGTPDNPCISEHYIGNFLFYSGIRDKIFLVTKGGHPPFSNMKKSRISAEEIEKDLEESLSYLRTDHIDLYLLHRDDASKPCGEIVEIMDKFVKAKMIDNWGVSNWETERISEAAQYANAHGLSAPVCNQAMWSYAGIRREEIKDTTLVPMEKDMFEFHKNTKMNLMAYTSQAKGYFPRRINNIPFDEEYKGVYQSDENDFKLKLISKVSKETGISVSALSLLFFANQPFTAIPVVSYSSKAHFEEVLRDFNPENAEKAKELLTRYDFC